MQAHMGPCLRHLAASPVAVESCLLAIVPSQWAQQPIVPAHAGVFYSMLTT